MRLLIHRTHILNSCMEEQVISRAHRMGAIRPIHVETLVMHETIEEQMVQFLQDTDECKRLMKEEFGKPDYEGPRAHRSLHDFAGSNYLSQLKFVRTNPILEKGKMEANGVFSGSNAIHKVKK